MVNITHKSHTLRKAVAQALVLASHPSTIEAIRERRVPKGDVLEAARIAGLFAAKRTSDMIPDCHPLPIEFASITFEVQDMQVLILAEIHTIYKTGVEVEAMHAASVAALTMYDMLKPIDKGVEISRIRLLEKSGGKSSVEKKRATLKAAVIVCSDSIAAQKKEDKAGKAIMEKLRQHGVATPSYIIIPDEIALIQQNTLQYCEEGYQIIIVTGGTGLSKRDVTPEALRPLLHREIPGVVEAIRAYGQDRTPYAMLSRSVAGLIGNTLVLALPGSTRGASESMDAVFPAILHIFSVIEGTRHE